MKKIFLFFLFICGFYFAQAQEPVPAGKDSTRAPATMKLRDYRTFFFEAQDFGYDTTTYQTIDTFPDLVWQYNLLQYGNKEVMHLGPSGSASKPLVFRADNQLFRWGFNQYAAYETGMDQPVFARTNLPFTQAQATVGAYNEQVTDFIHTQNITRNFNFLVSFKKLGSDGVYRNQKTDNKQFLVTTNYFSKNNRYRIFGLFTRNTFKDQQNGGLLSDSIFIIPNDTLPQIYSVALPNATSGLRKTNYQLTQSLSPFKNDSTANFRLYHRLQYQRTVWLFRDTDPTLPFYPQQNISDTLTRDSLFASTFGNSVGIQFGDAYSALKFSAGLQQMSSRYFQNEFDSSFSAVALEGKLGFKYKSFQINSNTEIWVLGRLAGSFRLYGEILGGDKSGFHFNGNVLLSNKNPDFTDNFFYSNAFSWQNNFANQNVQSLEGNIGYKNNIKAFVAFHRIGNYLYTDSASLPAQFGGNIAIAQLGVQWKLRYRLLNYSGNAVLQAVDQSAPLKLPSFWTAQSLYVSKTFKRGFTLLAGVDMKYNTLFFGDGFQPVSGRFTLQNDFAFGNYTLFDAYFATKISRVMIFAKMEHFNYGLMKDQNGFSSRGHGHYPRALRFGINWVFYN